MRLHSIQHLNLPFQRLNKATKKPRMVITHQSWASILLSVIRYDRGSERKNSISLSLGKLAKP